MRGGGGGVSPQPPPVCSIHWDDATAATGQRRQCAHHTPATGGEEREIEPIKCLKCPTSPLNVLTCFPSSLGSSLVQILLHSGWTHFKHECAHYSVSTLLKGLYRFSVFTHHCSSLMQSNFWGLGSWVRWPLGRSLLPKAEQDCGNQGQARRSRNSPPTHQRHYWPAASPTTSFSFSNALLWAMSWEKEGRSRSGECPHWSQFSLPLMPLPLCSLL